MSRTLAVNGLQPCGVCWQDIVQIMQNHEKNGDRDTTCSANMAQVSNDARVSDQGYQSN
jgi:hypothetical protein